MISMDFFLENWLAVGTSLFLLAMVLYGHYRGFIRQAVSMTALIIALVVVRMATPYVTDFIRQNTPIPQMIQQGLVKMAGAEDLAERMEEETTALPAGQRILIEQLKLPEQMKEALIENNNNEVYHILGVEAFVDYVGAYLANMVLNTIGAVLLFIIVYLLLRLLIHWLDVLARLPVLSGMNQLAGAALGAVQGLMILWLLCLLVRACAGTGWGNAVLEQISGNQWLLFLYQNNLFQWLLMGILNAMLA